MTISTHVNKLDSTTTNATTNNLNDCSIATLKAVDAVCSESCCTSSSSSYFNTLSHKVANSKDQRSFNTKMFKHCRIAGDFVYLDKEFYPKQAQITRVIYSNPATIVFWSDGTKTVCKCHKDDVYSPEAGLIICILKKISTPSAVKDTIDTWVPKVDYKQNTKVVRTLKEVRKENRKK